MENRNGTFLDNFYDIFRQFILKIKFILTEVVWCLDKTLNADNPTYLGTFIYG